MMERPKRLTGKEEPEPEPWPAKIPMPARPDPLPDLPGDDPAPADGVRVGESPAPGLTLRRILRGHTAWIGRIAWSPDGRLLASPSADRTIRIWDVARGECVATLEGHTDMVFSAAWSPDGRRLASGSKDQTACIWEAEGSAPDGSWRTRAVLEEHTGNVWSVAWSPDGRRLASGSVDRTVRIWEAAGGAAAGAWRARAVLEGHTSSVNCVAWSPDGCRLALGAHDGTVRTWDVEAAAPERTLEGHRGSVFGVAWAPDRPLLASFSNDLTIRLWDAASGQAAQVLEGHTRGVNCLSFSINGTLLASKALDGVRLWRTDTWETVAILLETAPSPGRWPPGLDFHPRLPRLATLGEEETVLRIWDLDVAALLGQAAGDSVRYTTAKVVLVGDTGVGKTGLGWRLAHGEFKEQASTHGQQFWVVDALGTTREDGTECEAVLWDLAGQHVYRPIHSIFLDNVDASLVLFDPGNRQEPLKGAEFWLEQLSRARVTCRPACWSAPGPTAARRPCRATTWRGSASATASAAAT